MNKYEGIIGSSAGAFKGVKPFWFLNVASWILYNLIHSFSMSFNGDTVYVNFMEYLPVAILGIGVASGVRYCFSYCQWNNVHPIKLIPWACLIAFLFSFSSIFLSIINAIDLSSIEINKSCFNLFSSSSCGKIAIRFSHNQYAMLVWVMLYFFIEHERNGNVNDKPSARSILIGFFSLILLKEIDFYASVVAGFNGVGSEYLFSNEYFLSNFLQIFCAISFSLFVLLVEPRESLLNSRLLPLIPTIFTLVFCSSVLSVWCMDVAFRAWYFLTYVYLPEDGQVLSYLLFGSQSSGVSSNVFAGSLRGAFSGGLVSAIFILYCRYSQQWVLKPSALTEVFNPKKVLQFWLYNLGGWFIAGFCVYASSVVDVGAINPSLAIAFSVAFIGVGIFIGVVIRSVIRHYRLVQSTLFYFAYKVSIIAVCMGFLQTFALWFFNYIYIYSALSNVDVVKYENFIRQGNYFYPTFLICTLCCFLWALIYDISVSQREKSEYILRQLQLENNIKEVQLNALAGKIDPHFIFNALNNIRSLINEDKNKAREAILALSNILRSPLSKSLQDKVTVLDELTLVRYYIALSKIQFENRLLYIENVSESVLSALIPSMMLQILVENAIKHGISQLPDGGSLALAIQEESGVLVCRLSNHGQLLSSPVTQGFGVGIKNIRERINILYTVNASFNLYSENDNVVAILKLPIEY